MAPTFLLLFSNALNPEREFRNIFFGATMGRARQNRD